MKEHEKREQNGAKAKIKDVDVKWPNTDKGEGWKIADYEKEMAAISALPEDALARLERFANLFTKSLDLIVTALSSNRTIPHAIFKIRDHFALEICDSELPHVLEHVEALVEVTKRELGESEALTEQEAREVASLVPFFKE